MSYKFMKPRQWLLLTVWLVWPALIAYLLRDVPNDPLGGWLRNYFYYPRSLENITSYWIKAEPAYMSIYLNAWYVNAYITLAYYAMFLWRNPQFVDGMRRQPTWKLSSWVIACLLLFLLWNSSILFDASKTELGQKEAFLISNEIAFFLILPIVPVWIICIGGAVFFLSLKLIIERAIREN